MKTLVVYYSRTGTTKKVGKKIGQMLKCDSEEIIDVKDRKGALGYTRSGKEAMLKTCPKIKPIKKNPAKYDLVIIGTPVWFFTMASPVRTYLSKNKFKKVAFFLTMHGSGDRKTFKAMQRVCKKKPVSVLSLTMKEVKNGDYIPKIKQFIKTMG